METSDLMLAHMESYLQQQLKNVEAHYMIVSLNGMFQTQARTEKFNVSQVLIGCKMEEDNPLGPHVIMIFSYIHSLNRLGFPLGEQFVTDVILLSLPNVNDVFMANYHRHGTYR